MVQPDWTSMHAVLDTAKVCDSLVLLLCPHTGMDSMGEQLLSAVLAQGLSTDPIFVVGNLDEIPPKKHIEVKKLLAKSLERKLPVEKVWSVEGELEAVNLVRAISCQKRREQKHRDRRANMLGEKVEWKEDEVGSGMGTLAVTGYVRGSALCANRLVHVPGWGDFQVDRIETAAEPVRMQGGRGDQEMVETRVVDRANQDRQELDMENIPDNMEGEQTWPTEEELLAAEQNRVGVVRKVPKGTSEYQAAWIQEEDEESGDDDASDGEEESDEDMGEGAGDIPEDEEDESEDEQANEDDFDTQSVAMTEDGGDYDAKHVHFAAEMEEMESLKVARMDSMFPDEIDTPMDVPARIRFQKYRGLKSFRTSIWDPKENLPLDYARIFQFENFDRTRRRVLSEEVGGAEVGWYVTVYLVGVGRHLASTQSTTSLVLTSLLPHEHRMSVLNMAVRRSPLSGDIPIKSKARLVFQCGWRRFAACPIFSQHTNGNKHKYERFFRDGNIVMTTFAPISFPPAPVLVFQEHPSGRQSLLATGSLLSADPNRVVVKRTVLSGHAFKVHKRMCTIRFMFFNREDIEWFSPVELRTRNGRRGHIKDGLGTHGHMKCIFDGQVTQQDTVMMHLFKRMFPKWTYDPFVASYTPSKDSLEDSLGDSIEEDMEDC
eukprot:GFUD01019879.1.p1 GENE.GFUD01019879.1~~GFUD01019879.1.p1  ORF type:complete len:755 (+),score=290.87 GFUD01019879.1:292-2265(+)